MLVLLEAYILPTPFGYKICLFYYGAKFIHLALNTYKNN